VAYDASGNGNDGVFVGDPQWVAGIIGGALEFSGNDYLNCGRGDSLNIRDQITMAFWFQVEAFTNTWEAFLAKSDGAYRASRGDGTGNGTHMGITGGNYFNAPTIVTDGQWHHYCSTYDGSAAIIYIDGVEDARQTYSGQIGDSSAYDLYIGENSGATGRMLHGLLDDVRLYSRALPVEEILVVMAGYGGNMASNPRPEDEAIDVPRDVVLSWDPMETTTTRDVYFGTVFNDVNNASRANPMGVLLSQGQTATTFDPPGLLDFGQTYYWRIDEVNAPPDSTIFKGEVWSFTAEPFAYPVQNIIATSNGTSDEVSTPQRTVDGSGINANDQASTNSADMWLAMPGADPLYIQYEFDRVYKLHEMLVWNYNVQFEVILGFGLKGVTVEYSENGTDWTALGDVEFAKAAAKATYTANTTVDFGGAPVKYVRLNVNSGWGVMGQFGLSEVRFLYIPAHAREPQPADGAADVEVGTALAWRSGREAASHEVYLSTDPNALTLAGTVGSATFVPGNLEFGSTYYWQVVEVNEADATTAWAGDVWSFSTQEYALIDGFEAYNDDIDAGTAIFDTWLDGWVNDSGSTVGYFDAPFAEKTIVRTGVQSMPLQYDNSVSPFYSEAEREFETAQNWTGNGANTLVLYVRGNAPDFVETAAGQIIMSAIGTDIWDVADQFRYAYKSLSGNGSILVRVDSVVNSNVWAKAGVMIRETLEPGSKHAFMCVTPGSGASLQRRPVAGQASANTDVAGIVAPHWVKLTRTGNTFTAQQSADGVTWTDVVVSPALDIQMASNVYIGLALCSHDAAIVTAAEFSNLSMTGNVTGAWQTAEIGVAQPMGNSAESMYVTIEDSTGKTKTVTNADAAITQRPTWQEWAIPYSDLSGVSLSKVQKMVIGVGSKTSPKAGGTGIVYIDDIGYGRPAAQ
jgi:regulation of enolase protein 1 (concanavalin A-like superfamily)